MTHLLLLKLYWPLELDTLFAPSDCLLMFFVYCFHSVLYPGGLPYKNWLDSASAEHGRRWA